MENLVGLTKLVFDGKPDNIHATESLVLHCMSNDLMQSVENKNCNKGLQENTYSSK